MIIKILRYPAQKVSDVIHKLWPHDKKHSKIAFGVLLMATGSILATEIHQTFIPHFVWDACAYFLHGFGATPVIESILTKIE